MGSAGISTAGPDRKRLRPRDASALMLLDRSEGETRVLVGRRSCRHAFMPDLYVFPGGRRDTADNKVAPSGDYHPDTLCQLQLSLGQTSSSRLRGFGICALRELAEETGLARDPDQFRPDLSMLRYVARAITPPGSVRRYDTQFFACFCDELGLSPDQVRDSDELTDLRFIPLSGDNSIRMPDITQLILAELHSFVMIDPSLGFRRAIPTYWKRRGQHVRDLIAESETA